MTKPRYAVVHSTAAAIIILMILLMIAFACSNEEGQGKPKDIAYFKDNLALEMTHATILNKFGEPDSDMGSGIHIYVYKLSDGSAVWIGCTDKILYAQHRDSQQLLIETLI